MLQRDEYVEKLKVQLDHWNAEVAKWEAKAAASQTEPSATSPSPMRQ